MQLKRVILYDEPAVPEFCAIKQAEFLESELPVRAEVRGGVMGRLEAEHGPKLRAAIVRNMREEVGAGGTEHAMAHPADGGMVPIHDGYALLAILKEAVQCRGRDTLHIVFTGLLTATFSRDDCRYHARPIIASNPAIISARGMVEGPARPRRYYAEMLTARTVEDKDEIAQRYAKEFLRYRDPRTAQIAKGYLLQAAFYHETGDAFCADMRCSLYNSHWQRDLLRKQAGPELCAAHRTMQGGFFAGGAAA